MYDIFVEHVKKPLKADVTRYVGRPSVLGNPFVMKNKTLSERTRVISQYRVWLWQNIKDKNSVVIQELKGLHALHQQGSLSLSCWCAPQLCHADVIKK